MKDGECLRDPQVAVYWTEGGLIHTQDIAVRNDQVILPESGRPANAYYSSGKDRQVHKLRLPVLGKTALTWRLREELASAGTGLDQTIIFVGEVEEVHS
jgi:hypothetical protein